MTVDRRRTQTSTDPAFSGSVSLLRPSLELLPPRERPLELREPPAYVQLHTEVPEAHPRRVEGLEQVVRPALLAHLADSHHVQTERTGYLDVELSRHVREHVLRVHPVRHAHRDDRIEPVLPWDEETETHGLEPRLKRQRAHAVAL